MDIYRVAVVSEGKENGFVGSLILNMMILLRKHEWVEFYLTGKKRFDRLVIMAIKLAERETGRTNRTVKFILPQRSFEENAVKHRKQASDFCLEAECIPMRGDRTKWCIDQADLILSSVSRTDGVAYRALQYADARGIPINNYNRFS